MQIHAISRKQQSDANLLCDTNILKTIAILFKFMQFCTNLRKLTLWYKPFKKLTMVMFCELK